MNKPLQGLRVVEFATYVAAPTAGRLLADMGAEVIKVEAPRGDAWRYSFGYIEEDNPRFHICNGGKKSVVLDLKTEEGMEAMLRLVARADVFITNVRRQSLLRLQLDPDTLRTRHPRLIYAALTGYGTEGPDADLPGFDAVAFWARSGALADLSIRTERSYPVEPPIGGGDMITSMMFYSAILAALLQREGTGRGDYVTVSLYNAGMWVMSCSIAAAQDRGRAFRHELPRTREQCAPETSAYLCADGEWIQLCLMEPQRYGDAFYAALGYPGILQDPRFSTIEKKLANSHELLALAEKAFLTKTADQWVGILSALDIVCAKIAHFADIPHSEQAWANDYLQKVVYPSGKERVLPLSPIRLETQGVQHLPPAPALGQHTREILAELGLLH